MNNKLKLVFAALLCLGSLSVQAWGLSGHRIISEIAEQHLSKKARKNIDQLIGNQRLAYWSNWADFIKSDSSPRLQATSPWHFVNAPANQDYASYLKVLNESPEDNLYKAYLTVKQHAKSRKGDLAERREQLYFILHLVGDMHQPMHVGRLEDFGGNTIDITFFGRKTNLHRLWDTDLVDNEKYSYTEYARVLDIRPGDYKKYTQGTGIENWLFESHQVANKIYDQATLNKTLSYSYVYDFKYIMEECLLKAGLRLAKELNEIYG